MNSGFYLDLSGKDKKGDDKTKGFELITRSGDGPYIPCIPAILVAKKLIGGKLRGGAQACMGMVNKKEYLDAFEGLDISWVET